MRLVQSIANKFNVPTHLDRDDIVQDGMIGLDKAVEKFDWRTRLQVLHVCHVVDSPVDPAWPRGVGHHGPDPRPPQS